MTRNSDCLLSSFNRRSISGLCWHEAAKNWAAQSRPPIMLNEMVLPICFSDNVEKILWKGIFKWKEMYLIVSINVKIYNAERREFSIHISVKKFWSENFGQQSEGGKTPDDLDGHLQPDHWFKFVIDFRFRLSCHWRFIDGVVNTFSNAHYSQTTHPNWTKPSQGASPNVRISFGNNMGPKNFFVTFYQSVLRGRNVL